MIRSPTLHFAVLGLLAFLAFGRQPAPPELLVIDPQALAQTIGDWEALQRSPVDDRQRQLAIQQLVRSTALVRIALESGLDRSAVIEQRLLNLARFLGLVDPDATDMQAIEAARGLDLHLTDEIARRYLEKAAEFLLAGEVAGPSLFDPTVEHYYREHPAEFRIPAQIRLVHVYIALDAEADSTDNGAAGWSEAADRAAALAKRVAQGSLPPAEAIELGDRFYAGHYVNFKTRRQLAAMMGEAFAAAVWPRPSDPSSPTSWSMPIRSAYGLHLVRVVDVIPERLQPLDQVRSDIAARLRHQHRQRKVEREVARRLQRYHVVDVPADAAIGAVPLVLR